MRKRGEQRFLDIVLIAPLVGILLRVWALGPTHPYLLAMYGLVLVALIGRLAPRPIAAYCVVAPICSLAMVWADTRVNSYAWSMLGFVPLAGLFAVMVWERDFAHHYLKWTCAQIVALGLCYGNTGGVGVGLLFAYLEYEICRHALDRTCPMRQDNTCAVQKQVENARTDVRVIKRGLNQVKRRTQELGNVPRPPNIT